MLKTVQACRGVAALAVVAFHLSTGLGHPSYGGVAAFEPYTRFGNLGVDFFFVLSGFIILHAHAKDVGRPDRLRVYVGRRFVRLFPIYWLYTLPIAAAATLGMISAPIPDTWVGWATSLTLIRFSDVVPPHPVAWTLFHEVAFYAVFAVLLLSRRLGTVLLAIWAMSCLAVFQYPGDEEHTPLLVYTAAYNLDFLFGMAAYALYRNGLFLGPITIGGVAGAGFSLVLAYQGQMIHHLTFALSCALFIGGVAGYEKTRGLQAPSLLVILGNASYTIYLTHEILHVVGLKLTTKLGVLSALGPHGTFLLILAFSLAAGCAIYRMVEVPVLLLGRRWLEGGISRGPVPALSKMANWRA